ncbi:hypothetical protein FGB62_114g012 [Gracilaria domingensis]|nr:hypothetical protein FGB62_114g012 [Gracilaria domingensis]
MNYLADENETAETSTQSETSTQYCFKENCIGGRFPFHIRDENDYERSLLLDKASFDQLNDFRTERQLESIAWSSYMNGKAMEICSKQLREGRFIIETNDADCFAASFIVRDKDVHAIQHNVMRMGLAEAMKKGYGLTGVPTQSGFIMKGAVAVFTLENAVMVTIVVGHFKLVRDLMLTFVDTNLAGWSPVLIVFPLEHPQIDE